jgi:hypothetical protein
MDDGLPQPYAADVTIFVLLLNIADLLKQRNTLDLFSTPTTRSANMESRAGSFSD